MRLAEAQRQIDEARAAPVDAELEAQLSDAALSEQPAARMFGYRVAQAQAAPPPAREGDRLSALNSRLAERYPGKGVQIGALPAGGLIAVDNAGPITAIASDLVDQCVDQGDPVALSKIFTLIDRALAALARAFVRNEPARSVHDGPPVDSLTLTGAELTAYRALQAAAKEVLAIEMQRRTAGGALHKAIREVCAVLAPGVKT